MRFSVEYSADEDNATAAAAGILDEGSGGHQGNLGQVPRVHDAGVGVVRNVDDAHRLIEYL